jgi:hypothetical protein
LKEHLRQVIADNRMDKGLCDSAAAFQSDAMRFDYEIQSTTRAIAGSLQSMNRGGFSRRSKLRELSHALKSWLTRHLQKSPRAMTDSSAAARLALRAFPQFKEAPPAEVEPFVNRVASISSKLKFLAELPLNLCFPQTQIPALSRAFQQFSREYPLSRADSPDGTAPVGPFHSSLSQIVHFQCRGQRLIRPQKVAPE